MNNFLGLPAKEMVKVINNHVCVNTISKDTLLRYLDTYSGSTLADKLEVLYSDVLEEYMGKLTAGNYSTRRPYFRYIVVLLQSTMTYRDTLGNPKYPRERWRLPDGSYVEISEGSCRKVTGGIRP